MSDSSPASMVLHPLGCGQQSGSGCEGPGRELSIVDAVIAYPRSILSFFLLISALILLG